MFVDLPHILHIRDSSGIFGAERVILTLLNNIDRQKFRLSLLCLQREDVRNKALVDSANELGVHVFSVPVKGRLDIGAIRRIRCLFKQEDVICIHSHDFKSDFYGLAASVGLPVRRVATAHGSTRDSWKKRCYLLVTEQLTYKLCHRVVAVSKELYEYFLNKGFSAEKVRLIQNGLDFSLLSLGAGDPGEQNQPLTIPSGSKVFVVVGRLFPDKGHRFFLHAFKLVQQSYPDIVALIVGDGPSFAEILQQVQEQGLADSVFLTGVRKDIGAIYNLADFMVIPSLREGLPYVLLEAMASQVPVIATAVGDIPLLVKDGETGCLVAPGDADGIAGKMQMLLDHPGKAALIGRQALEHVQDHFSADAMVRETEKLYQELVEK